MSPRPNSAEAMPSSAANKYQCRAASLSWMQPWPRRYISPSRDFASGLPPFAATVIQRKAASTSFSTVTPLGNRTPRVRLCRPLVMLGSQNLQP